MAYRRGDGFKLLAEAEARGDVRNECIFKETYTDDGQPESQYMKGIHYVNHTIPLSEQHEAKKVPTKCLKDTIPAELKKYFFRGVDPPSLLSDYDAVGFDMDHTVVKYNVR